MPSERATAVAKHGPRVVTWLFIGCVLVWLLGRLAVGQFLSRGQRGVFGGVVLVAFSLSVLYQGLFMLVFPGTAVEVAITPPTTVQQRRVGYHEWLTPETTVGARAIGLLGVLASLFGFSLAGLFLGLYP